MKFDSLTNNKEINIPTGQNIFAEYYFIQPAWFDDNIKSEIDEWIYMFKHSEIKGKLKATNIDKAREKLDELKMTPEERAAYESYELNKAINEDIIRTAKNDAHEDGRVSERQAMIQAMKANGMSDAEIDKIIKAIN